MLGFFVGGGHPHLERRGGMEWSRLHDCMFVVFNSPKRDTLIKKCLTLLSTEEREMEWNRLHDCMFGA